MTRRETASRTALLAACGYPFREGVAWYDPAGAPAIRGTRLHEPVDRYIKTGVREDLRALYAELPEADREDLAGMYAAALDWVDDYGRKHLRSEVAFGWDPQIDLGEELATTGRDYAAAQARGLMCGTADVVALVAGGRAALIADWKTGDGSGAGPQLRTLAVMASRALRLDSVTVCALEVTAAGVREVCRETLDAFELDAHAGELAELLARVPTAEPTPGPHCSEGYCPARATCPAGREAAEQLVPVDALVPHRMSVEIQGPDHAAWMLDRVRLVESACKQVKDAIKAACPDEGWTLADGRTLREGTRKVERFRQAQAMLLLKEKGATDEELASLWYEAKESSGLRVSGGAAKPARKRGKAAA